MTRRFPGHDRIPGDPAGRQRRRRRPHGDGLVAGDGRTVGVEEAVHLPPVLPSKIICVHLNYASRVEEMMITLPPAPTYFHKPVSALNAHGSAVVRPSGCKWLNYEGEIAIVIGLPRRTSLPPTPATTSVVTRSPTTTGCTTSGTPSRFDAAGQGRGHAVPHRPRPGHGVGLPSQADPHPRQWQGPPGRLHRRDAVGHALSRRRHRPDDHPEPETCCSRAPRRTPVRSIPATWSRSRSKAWSP